MPQKEETEIREVGFIAVQCDGKFSYKRLQVRVNPESELVITSDVPCAGMPLAEAITKCFRPAKISFLISDKEIKKRLEGTYNIVLSKCELHPLYGIKVSRKRREV